MKAWIGRDEDGSTRLFSERPRWSNEPIVSGMYWCGFDITDFEMGELVAIAESLALQPGYCQPITLTATPAGEAQKGES